MTDKQKIKELEKILKIRGEIIKDLVKHIDRQEIGFQTITFMYFVITLVLVAIFGYLTR